MNDSDYPNALDALLQTDEYKRKLKNGDKAAPRDLRGELRKRIFGDDVHRGQVTVDGVKEAYRFFLELRLEDAGLMNLYRYLDASGYQEYQIETMDHSQSFTSPEKMEGTELSIPTSLERKTAVSNNISTDFDVLSKRTMQETVDEHVRKLQSEVPDVELMKKNTMSEEDIFDMITSIRKDMGRPDTIIFSGSMLEDLPERLAEEVFDPTDTDAMESKTMQLGEFQGLNAVADTSYMMGIDGEQPKYMMVADSSLVGYRVDFAGGRDYSTYDRTATLDPNPMVVSRDRVDYVQIDDCVQGVRLP